MRRVLKSCLARVADRAAADGITVLIYHRVGAGTPDERDLAVADFTQQLDVLARHRTISIDAAEQQLRDEDRSPAVVVTFDDGFADMYHNAWPALRDRRIPFTLYLASGFVGGTMHWDGS